MNRQFECDCAHISALHFQVQNEDGQKTRLNFAEAKSYHNLSTLLATMYTDKNQTLETLRV